MTYSEILDRNMILPYKAKYTKADFARLVQAGHAPKLARFICLCSAFYYDTSASRPLYGWELVRAEEYRLGLPLSC